jgi:hypothetical protein
MTGKGFRTRCVVGGVVSAALAAIALLATPAWAQTIRPVIVEYKGTKVHGKFDLVNDQLLPVNVILEPKSFDVTDAGDPIYRPLDKSVTLKLSEMSFRIPAQQSRTIFFEARAESIPAWFTIFATFAGMPRRQGIEIEVELPHTVYMLTKQPLAAADVHVESATWDSLTKNVTVRLRNVSGRLGRVEEAEALAKKEKSGVGSFPLLPHASRVVVIPWKAPVAPSVYRFRFQRFALEDSLRAG